MDEATLVEVLSSLGLGIALASCAGLRAWLPLLLAGALHRAGWFELGPAFEFLGSNRALVLFGIATVIEMAADKIPALDHALDTASTLLRPAAGALLAASVFDRFADPLTAIALGVAVGAPASLVPHAAKSALRTVSTALTGGIANPILSLLEDVMAVCLFILSLLVPIAVAVVLLFLALVVVRRLLRRRAPAPKLA